MMGETRQFSPKIAVALYTSAWIEILIQTRNNPDTDYKSVINASKVAQIHDEIMQLPLKYNTMISEQGQNFSGGQRQRISIARAIAINPTIIILDEATNSLDNITEKKIEQYLTSLNVIRIVIAHRLSTIKDADKILVMNDDRIVAQGSHEFLLKTSEYYHDLYSSNKYLDSTVIT